MTRAERGNAMLLVLVFGVVAMATWLLAFRATMDSAREEVWTDDKIDRDATVLPALAHGIALLRTSEPPENPYACVVDVEDVRCKLTFTTGGEPGAWTVESVVADEDEAKLLPLIDDVFPE